MHGQNHIKLEHVNFEERKNDLEIIPVAIY